METEKSKFTKFSLVASVILKKFISTRKKTEKLLIKEQNAKPSGHFKAKTKYYSIDIIKM